MKAIHKDRNQRFANANEMLRELEKLERSGETVFQDVSKYVSSVLKQPEPAKPTVFEPKKPQVDNTSRPKTVIRDPEKKQNKTWLWLAGVVALVVVILGIVLNNFKQESKIIAPVQDTTRVEAPIVDSTVSNVSAEVPEGMILVEGGTFSMGSNDGDSFWESDQKPVHSVTVSSFYLGKTEVTQELWKSLMGNNPSEFKGDKRPVERVSWDDVTEFCNKLSDKEGLQKAYSGSGDNKVCDFNSNGYRLSTEAEWEYAARGGSKRIGYKYAGSNSIDEVAWYSGNSGDQARDVGTKNPNELGLYDMTGNVYERCWDWYDAYISESQTNPRGPNSGGLRVFRGSGWLTDAELSRVSCRSYGSPDFRDRILGFRLARTRLIND